MFQFCDRYRFLVVLVTFLCLVSICSNYTIINFTFICMTNDVNDTITLDDGTLRQRYDYTPHEKSAILMSVAAGTIIGTFPVNFIFTKRGTRFPFLIAGLLSAAATAAIPWAAGSSFIFFLALRFLQGIAYAADFATIGLVTVEWAPLRETSFFLGFLTVFTIGSAVVTNPLSGFVCEAPNLGWRWSFYLHAGGGVVLFIIWFLLYSDSPRNAGTVSERELRTIHKGKSKEHAEGGDRRVPYMAVIRNPTILVIWLCAFCELTSTILLITYAPTYFNKVLNFDVSTTGLLASLASFSQLPFKVSFCVTSDRLRCMSEKKKMILYNTICFALCGACYMFIGMVPWPWLSIVLFCLVSITSSANCGSFYKCAAFVARQHSHFVISAIQFSKCLALFAAPAIVAILVKSDYDASGWNLVFIVNGAALVAAHVLFCFFVTDEAADFTKSSVSSGKATVSPLMTEGKVAPFAPSPDACEKVKL